VSPRRSKFRGLATNGATDAEQQALDAGANAFLAKPLSPRRLRELVEVLAVTSAPRQPR